MSNERKTTEGAMKTEPTHATAPAPSAARRRLLRGGLAVAPVVMASAPRSVMAGGGTGFCVPASSFASINTSRPDFQSSCSGRSPGYWKQTRFFGQWPAGYVPEGPNATKFDDVFGAWGGFPGLTLLAVLDPEGGGPRKAVAKHIVAALLNAARGFTPGVLAVDGEKGVKAIWSSFVAKGFYEPTAGIKWYADYSVPAGAGGIIPWLKSTMA